MLYSLKDIGGFTLAARDGEVGKVREAYFDDARWTIRHLVVHTGGWLSGRNVLISPHAITGIEREPKQLNAALTRQQIENAPDIDTDRPVSRQHEVAYNDYYSYPYYWTGGGVWGVSAFPMLGIGVPPTPHDDPVAREMPERESEAADPHLRSSAEVTGYDLAASDGRIGHIDDFLFDDQSWAIRYAVVDTHNWLPDRLVLVSPAWIDRVSWSARRVHFKITRESVKDSPAYDRYGFPLSAYDEERLHRHYGRG